MRVSALPTYGAFCQSRAFAAAAIVAIWVSVGIGALAAATLGLYWATEFLLLLPIALFIGVATSFHDARGATRGASPN